MISLAISAPNSNKTKHNVKGQYFFSGLIFFNIHFDQFKPRFDKIIRLSFIYFFIYSDVASYLVITVSTVAG